MFSSNKLVLLSELLFDTSSNSHNQLLANSKQRRTVRSSLSSEESDQSDFEMEKINARLAIESFKQKLETCTNEEFKSLFRLERSTVEYLISLYKDSFKTTTTPPDPAAPKINHKKDVRMYCWYVTHTIGYKELGLTFGASRINSQAAVRRVSHWLISIGHNHMDWPLNDAAMETSRKFEEIAGIPNVIGAMASIHIDMKAPTVNKHLYYNRHHRYSVYLQVVADTNKKFTNVCSGEKGSYNKIQVLQLSELYNRTINKYREYFHGNSFIVTDYAYPSSKWMVPPYPECPELPESKRKFNRMHAETRAVVDEALALLKARFQRLSMFTEEKNGFAVANLVASTCVLHNICIEKGDAYSDPLFKVTYYHEQKVDDEERCEDNYVADVAMTRRRFLYNLLTDEKIL